MHKNTVESRIIVGRSGRTTQPRRPTVGYRGSQNTQQPRSSNVMFRQLVRLTHKLMSGLHHLRNWQTLPRGIENQVGGLVRSIHLPSLDVMQKEKSYSDPIVKIEQIVLQWGQSQLEELIKGAQRRLEYLDMTDAYWAIGVATAQLRRRMGRRLTEEDLRFYEGEAKKIIDPLIESHTARRSAHIDSNAATNPSHNEPDDADVEASQMDVAPPVEQGSTSLNAAPAEQGSRSPVRPAAKPSPRRTAQQTSEVQSTQPTASDDENPECDPLWEAIQPAVLEMIYQKHEAYLAEGEVEPDQAYHDRLKAEVKTATLELINQLTEQDGREPNQPPITNWTGKGKWKPPHHKKNKKNHTRRH